MLEEGDRWVAVTYFRLLPVWWCLSLTETDILGQKVRTLVRNSSFVKGDHFLIWRGDNDYGTHVGSGVYFCQIEATPFDGSPKFVATRKMLLLK